MVYNMFHLCLYFTSHLRDSITNIINVVLLRWGTRQYKNFKNIINLCFLKHSFEINAE